ncbi:MAG: hypothetical protein D4S01_11480 [Dehalococcoidia bacterium]|nr:MAG: hypothetical protein D4S01_11480 [Dehalococcoidia bacterium]
MSDSISKYYERLEGIEYDLKALIKCISEHTVENMRISEYKCSEIYLGRPITIDLPNGFTLDINLKELPELSKDIVKAGSCKFGYFVARLT